MSGDSTRFLPYFHTFHTKGFELLTRVVFDDYPEPTSFMVDIVKPACRQ